MCDLILVTLENTVCISHLVDLYLYITSWAVQNILNVITQHVQGNQMIEPDQHEFMKVKSCLTNLISFCDKVTCLADE